MPSERASTLLVTCLGQNGNKQSCTVGDNLDRIYPTWRYVFRVDLLFNALTAFLFPFPFPWCSTVPSPSDTQNRIELAKLPYAAFEHLDSVQKELLLMKGYSAPTSHRATTRGLYFGDDLWPVYSGPEPASARKGSQIDSNQIAHWTSTINDQCFFRRFALAVLVYMVYDDRTTLRRQVRQNVTVNLIELVARGFWC